MWAALKSSDVFYSLKETEPNLWKKKRKEKTKETEEENSSGHMKWDLEERILQAWT